MKCQNCGSDIPQGEYFCPFCGAEVQLVQDYRNAVEYMLQEKELKEQEARKKQEEEERLRREEELRRKPKAWVLAVKTLLMLTGTAALGAAAVRTIQVRNENSASFQKRAALTAFEEKEYDKSRSYLGRAQELAPDSVDLMLLNARLLEAEGRPEEAIALLREFLSQHNTNLEAYRLLVSIYDDLHQVSEIVALVKEMPSGIQTEFSQYLVEAPSLSLAGGSYDFGTRLTMEAAGDVVIYYTTNGSEPTKKSTQYQNPIIMPLGRITVKAIAVNSIGAASDVTEEVYQINRVVPNLTGRSSSSSSDPED